MGLFGSRLDALERAEDVDGLIREMQRGSNRHREQAVAALGRMSDKAVPELMRQAPVLGEAAEEALAAIGAPALKPILDAIRSGETQYFGTLMLMATVEVPSALSSLCRFACNEESPDVREMAAACLRTIAKCTRSPIAACKPPMELAGQAKQEALSRYAALESTPVGEWRTCPACGHSLSDREAGAVQCWWCSRCYTDKDRQPIVCTDPGGWGRLTGTEPWRPLLSADVADMSRPHAWIPMPPSYYPMLVGYDGYVPDGDFWLGRSEGEKPD